MIFAAQRLNDGLVDRVRSYFRPRDLFFHDGSTLRRVRIGTRTQMGAAAGLLLLALWAVVLLGRLAIGAPVLETASARDMAAMQARVARIQAQYDGVKREAAAQAARLEKRQALLTAIVAGKADAATLASLLPAEGDMQASVAAHAVTAPLDKVAGQQLALADIARAMTEGRYADTVAALKKLGLDPRRFHGKPLAMGGPYEPVDPKSVAEGDAQFKALFLSWKKLDQLEQGVVAVPSQRPVQNIDFTSGFGVRSDPFRGAAAMHAGIDLAGPSGTPIYATADGTVDRAEWANGYGNLVELDHGRGIQTRYGHLSAILVRPGQRVKRGDLIAKMGSTGRSTGPHLHYEVRIDGHAVNPIPFLQSSDYLIALQKRTQTTQIALGGPDD